MKKLEILITQFEETDEIIKPLLNSIAIQQNVNFDDIGIIICNDGSNTHLSQNLLNSYDFDIKYILCEHKGVSATRNACLDNATAEYVMFCDADDMFYNACALYIIFQEINKGFDSLASVFIEETKNPKTKEIIYINREMDVTFIHGKIHNRQFLIENNIRWNESLTIHEDSYFNILCKTLAKNYKYVTSSFYLWRWRDSSVCRHDKDYILKTYNHLLDSNTALVYELLNKNHKSEAQFYITSMIFDTYYTLNKTEWWLNKNENYKKNVEKYFKNYYLRFKDLFNTTVADTKIQIIMGIKNRMYNEGLVLEKITFDDWIQSILE